jgi:hypothetical protein
MNIFDLKLFYLHFNLIYPKLSLYHIVYVIIKVNFED